MHLRSKGWRVLERDWRGRAGEIDCVALDGGTLVFVEVKARSGRVFGAAESVNAAKQRRLARAAREYVALKGWSGPCRFDVISIEGGALEHIRDAFDDPEPAP